MSTDADIKSWDASGPRDPDMTGSKSFGKIQDKAAAEPEQNERFPVQLPDGLDENYLIGWAKRRKASFRSWFKTEEQKITDSSKMYQSLPVAGMNGGSYVPLVYSVVETDTAKRLGAMFGKSKVVDAIQEYGPTITPGAVTDEENKILIDDLINQLIMASPARIQEKAYDAVKGQGVEGTGIGKLIWETYKCRITQPKMAPTINGPIQVGESTIEVPKGRPNVEFKSILNIGWEKRLATRLQDSDWIFETRPSSMNELLIEQDNGVIANVDEIERITSASKVQDKDLEAKRRTALNEGVTADNADGDGDEGVWMVDEWHAMVPYQAPQADGAKKWTHANLRFRIVNEQVLIKCEDNPWNDPDRGVKNPYFSFRYGIKPRQFLGMTVSQPIHQLQVDVNNLQTSSTKLVKKAAQNPTFYTRASGLDGRKVFLDENSLIPVNDASGISMKPIDGGAIKAVSEERGFLIDLGRETVAANEQAQAIQQGPEGTATEASIMNNNSGTRFQSVVDLTGWEFFCGIANGFYYMLQKWMQDGDIVVRESSVDGDPRIILRADVVNNYLFVPVTTASVSNQQAQLQKKMQWATQMQQIQMQSPMGMQNKDGSFVRFDVAGFTIKEIMPLLGIKNGRSYLVDTSPQEIMAKQAAAAGPPGLPPGGPGGPAGAGAQRPPQPIQRPNVGPADFPLPGLPHS